MVADYRLTFLLGFVYAVWCPAVIWQCYLTFLLSFMLLPPCFVSVCQFCHTPTPLPFVFALPEASLFHFASLCLHLSPCILSCSVPNPLLLCFFYPLTQKTLNWVTGYYFLSHACIFFLAHCLAVVLRILPHSQPGPERLWILLQDQRAEKEVAGTVWDGHVSVYWLLSA